MNLRNIALGSGWEDELTDSEKSELEWARSQSDPRRRMDAEEQFSQIVLDRRKERRNVYSGTYRDRANKNAFGVIMLWIMGQTYTIPTLFYNIDNIFNISGWLVWTVGLVAIIVCFIILCASIYLWKISEWFKLIMYFPLWVGQWIVIWAEQHRLLHIQKHRKRYLAPYCPGMYEKCIFVIFVILVIGLSGLWVLLPYLLLTNVLGM